MLDQNTTSVTTEPKDFVYGVLGLITRGPSLEQYGRLLKPDYTKSLAEVYRDATRFAILERRNLWLLRRISHLDDMDSMPQGFPSWVPQYNRSGRRATTHPVLLAPIYAADAESLTAHGKEEDLDSNILVLKGVIVGRIDKSSQVMRAAQPNVSANLEMFEAIEQLVSGTKGFSKDEKIDTEIAMTLIAGRNAQRTRADESELENYLAYRDYVRTRGTNPPPRRWLDSDVDSDTRAATQWHWAFMQASSNRRFFATDTGLPGIGPRQAKMGDIVTVLYGGMWPFVLRPVGDKHEILGAAYVHGIMHGEAVYMHRASGASDVTFSIR